MRGRPLDDSKRMAPAGWHWRPTATWLAFVALLSYVVLPSALSIVVGLAEPGRDTPSVGLCSGGRGDAPPGKTKPGLLVQHCALCTVPVATMPRPQGFAIPGEIADNAQLQLPATVSVVSIRHGGMQARAPPAAV
jgi:hypothetical protein